ncbi:MAG: lysophospholipid acyltransferase family protein [Rickettsiales bacterium]|jgi:lysophospholipid acyltransferase (LPLAT)-like uncharacterized protein|nr:lysophospholipid acyltransferase family protein [Rickettsiales bacterium]
MMKKILGIAPVQWLVAGIVSGVIWLIFLSNRVAVENRRIFKEYKKKPALFAFWHGRSMMLSPLVRTRGLSGYAISSMHRDGRLMAKIQRIFGLRPIFGSTSKNGASVLREGIRVLRRGGMICMTPDGPRGPRMRIKEDGIFYLAKITGAPVIPVCYSCSRRAIKRSWDRYMICKPFGRIKVDVGIPVYVPRSISEDELKTVKAGLEQTMVEQMQNLDAEFGIEKIQPADSKKSQ